MRSANEAPTCLMDCSITRAAWLLTSVTPIFEAFRIMSLPCAAYWVFRFAPRIRDLKEK